MNKKLTLILIPILIVAMFVVIYFLSSQGEEQVQEKEPVQKIELNNEENNEENSVNQRQQNEPIIFESESKGCANIVVYKTNSDDTAGIVVSASREGLNLSSAEKEFEISGATGLKTEILLGKGISRMFCNDVLYPDEPKPEKLVGKSGKVFISILDENKKNIDDFNRSYKTTVRLENVSFESEDSSQPSIFIDEIIFQNVGVGWLPG